MRYPAEKRTTVPTNPAFPTINGNRRNRMIPHIVRTTGKNTPDIEPSFALDFTRSSMGCLMGACDSWMGETAVLTLSLRASLTKSVSKALPALFWKRDISKWVLVAWVAPRMFARIWLREPSQDSFQALYIWKYIICNIIQSYKEWIAINYNMKSIMYLTN